MLETLGLDERAEAIYRALLTHADWDTEQITEHLGGSEGDARCAIERLSELGLLAPSVEEPNRLRAVRPEVALHALLSSQEAVLQRKRQELAESQAAVSRLIAEYSHLRPEAPSANHLGLDALHGRMEELTQSIESELLVLRPGDEPGMASLLEATRPHHEAMLARGVKMRLVYRDSVRNNPQTRAHAHWIDSVGGEMRTAPVVPLWLAVADRQLALVPVDPEDFCEGVVQVTGTGMVTALGALFDRIWASATPLSANVERDEAGLSQQERELLGLLAQGLTDEAAARRLGVSLRTVRRVMGDLMTRLEARSRFEAGFQVASRGWLKEP